MLLEAAGGYVSQVISGVNGYLVDWSNRDDVSSKIDRIVAGKLTNISPLPRNVVQADEIIPSLAKNGKLKDKSRIRKIVGYFPDMLRLMALSWVYEKFAQIPLTQDMKHANPTFLRNNCRQ